MKFLNSSAQDIINALDYTYLVGEFQPRIILIE